MKINAEKLARLIQEFSDKTVGCCTSTGACIGMIDGKEIQLRVQADEEEFMESPVKWECVSE